MQSTNVIPFQTINDLEYWNIGILEYWINGNYSKYFTLLFKGGVPDHREGGVVITSFHYSINPSFH